MSTSKFDLEAEWREACREFIKATEIDLDVASPTAEQITAKLDGLVEAKEAKSQTKVGKAKRAVGDALRAIQTIGSLLAQGAEMTGFGGPANVTMNCISFFIDAGFAYQRIAENIDDLFSRMAPIMERAQVYTKDRAVIGPEMELTTHRMLMAVVRTCQHCIGILRPVHSKRAKVGQFFKAAVLNDDSGVQAQINILVALQDQESKMASAVTVTTTKKTSADVRIVITETKNIAAGVGSINDRLSKNDAATAEEKIKKEFRAKLGVDENNLKSLQSQYRNRRDKLKSGSCAWLKDDSQYAVWSDPQKSSPPVMILSGDEGTGKSYAMTSVMQDLERRYPQGRDDSTRISLAYFYFTRNAQSGQNKDDQKDPNKGAKAAPSVREMLRTWACQCMENDTFYRKNVHRSLKDDPEFDKLDHFVQRLFLDQLPNGAVFFLLLDETHEMDEDGHSELSALLEYLSKTKADISSLRVMVTAKPSLQRELESRAPSSTVAVKLEEQNKSDIQDYVEAKANTFACFKTTSSEVQELKDWVISELPAAVKGNFQLAERKLLEISSCQDTESVRQIVKKIKEEGADLFDSIDKEVNASNKALSTKQVRNVNALLLWAIYAVWDLQVYEMEAVLYVQEQHKAFQPLAKELREQYAAFFNLSGSEYDQLATVTIKSSAHAEYFKDASRQQKSHDSSSNQALSKGQIQVVRHFVAKLCEKELYDKLGLAEFFDQKLQKSDVNISVDCDNAQAKIALGCLQALAGGLGSEADPLRTYARIHLTSHLKQVDLDIVDPLIKTEMGPLLVKMFTDKEVIQSANSLHWSSWAYNDAGLGEVVRLFKSSAVIKNIVRNDKDGETWINKVLCSESPELELLRAQSQAMAQAWVATERIWDAHNIFAWWYGFYNKMESKDTPSERLHGPIASYDEVSSDLIIQIYEKEIEPLLTSADPAESVRIRNLGLTLFYLDKIVEAIEKLTCALALDPDDLIAHDVLAHAYATEIKAQSIFPDWDKALHHTDIVIDQLKIGKKLFANEEAEPIRKTAVSNKAAWLRKLKRYEESQALLHNLLKEDPGDDNVRLELMQTLCQCQKFDEIVEMLQELENEVDEETNHKAISRFLQAHAPDATCHAVLVSTFRQKRQFEDVKRYYRMAIHDSASTKDESKQWREYFLIDGLASILFKFGEDPSDKGEAISLWEKGFKDHIAHRCQCMRQLCKAYIQQARDAGPGSAIADAMIDKMKKMLPGTDEVTEEVGYSQAEVRALLARYYRSVDDRTKAQQTLLPDMELALKLLHDDDDDNDWQGYRRLGDALMDYGATVEAQAAWSLIQPTQGISHLLKSGPPPEAPSTEKNSVEDQAHEPNSTTSGNADTSSCSSDSTASPPEPPQLKRANTTMVPSGPLNYSCDGRCGKQFTYADDFYICRECVDIQFTKDCLDKLLAGELERDVCDQKHSFLHVPAWTLASAERSRDGKVLVGESEKEIKVWLKEIAQAWNLSDVCVESAATTTDEK